MSDERSDCEFTSQSVSVEPASFSGAFFPKARHITVSGGTFTSITNNIHSRPVVPADFRRIPLGDIDLRRETRVDYQCGIVPFASEGRVVRRIYSAKIKINRRRPDMTVALYHAEEDWRNDISRYSCIRHPNFVQLYGVTSASGIHAAVFHDDMIPFKDFLHRYRDSHSIIVYLYGYWSWDFHQASEYFRRTFQTELLPHTSQLWIRSSTGLLCADPMDYTSGKAGCAALAPSPTSQPHPFAVLHETEPHVTPLISSMSLELYYFICWWHFADGGFIAIPVSETVRLGAVVLYPSGEWCENSVEIAAFTESVSLDHCAWEMNSCATVGELMDTGWTRFSASDGMGARDSLTLCIEWVKVDTSISRRAWFSQANHVFSLLHINSNHHDYGLTHDCEFQLNLIPTSETLPAGYLFICPPEDLRAGPSSFRWPDCAAYWSYDLEGVERLAVDEAARLGFPAIQLHTEIHTSWWNGSVYAGLQKFHEEKGFDPNSQDVARHLEYPLLEVYNPLAPFAFIEAEDSDAKEDNEGDKILD